MHSHWNLNLAISLKEIFFNASLPIFLLFIIFISYTQRKRLTKVTRFLFTFTTFLWVFFCFHYTPQILMYFLLSSNDKTLEKNFPITKHLINIPSCVENAHGIIVLGAGASYTSSPSSQSLTRILGLIDLLKQSSQENFWRTNKTPIIFSGGFTNPMINLSEAQVLKNYATYIYGNKFLDFNSIIENESKNTFENALFNKEFFDKNKIEKNIILITNTFHMNRARKAFEGQGFSVCPVSVSSQEIYGTGLFNFNNATKTTVLLNEYFGVVGYLAKGWIK